MEERSSEKRASQPTACTHPSLFDNDTKLCFTVLVLAPFSIGCVAVERRNVQSKPGTMGPFLHGMSQSECRAGRALLLQNGPWVCSAVALLGVAVTLPVAPIGVTPALRYIWMRPFGIVVCKSCQLSS